MRPGAKKRPDKSPLSSTLLIHGAWSDSGDSSAIAGYPHHLYVCVYIVKESIKVYSKKVLPCLDNLATVRATEAKIHKVMNENVIFHK